MFYYRFDVQMLQQNGPDFSETLAQKGFLRTYLRV